MRFRTFVPLVCLFSLAAAIPAQAFDPSGTEWKSYSAPAQAAGTKKAGSQERTREEAVEADRLSAYRNLGSWIDMFNAWVWKNPEATVRKMGRKGVTTLYLETSNYSKKVDLFKPRKIARFIKAAHANDIEVVAWYVPSFKNMKRDLRRSMKAINFNRDGQEFDSFSLDIEATVVNDIGKRNERLLRLSRRIRNRVGRSYTLGAIVPDAQSLYWPNFPYQAVARRYDVFLPMGYFTYRVSGRERVRQYTLENVRRIRTATGDPSMPIHAIGGIAGDMEVREARGFVDAVRQANILGGSSYDFPITTDGEWRVLRALAS